MINPFKEANWRPDEVALRSFAKSWMIGFPIIALLLLIVDRFRLGEWQPTFALLLGGLGAGAGLLIWTLPRAGRPIYLVWYALASCIGFVVGNVVLSLVFFVLVVGTGALQRLAGRQAVRKRPDRTARTYWIDAPPAPKSNRYFSQF